MYLVHVRPDQIIQFVQDSVNNFDEQVPLLVLESGTHQQRQNLVEERTSAELARFICYLTQGSFAHWRCAVLKKGTSFDNIALTVQNLIKKATRLIFLYRDYKQKVL